MREANNSNKAGKGRVAGRRRRVLTLGITLAGLALAAGLFIASRPWFVRMVIEPELARSLGGEVSMADARWVGLGRMELTGLSVKIPPRAGIPDQAREVAFVEDAIVQVNLLPLVIGRLSVRALEFDDVVLRLAEDMRDAGWFTFLDLDPQMASRRGRTLRPPRIEVRDVSLESGQYDEAGYYVLGRRRVAGSMQPINGSDGAFSFELAEVDERGGVLEDGLHIKGSWDVNTLHHGARIDGLALDERTFNMCPQVVRLWWEHMNLTGRVAEAKVRWTMGRSFEIELGIEQVGLTLPQQVDEFLVRYHDGAIIEHADRPRMELHDGVIRWTDDRVELVDLEGQFLSGEMADDEVVSVPYVVSLSIDHLPALNLESRNEWIAHAVEVAPFEMRIETSMDVTQRGGVGSRAVDLPLPVAKVFEQLGIADWSIDTVVHISRARPDRSESGSPEPAPIRWDGTLNIYDGSLQVGQFPYRVNEVDAHLEIEQDVIHVRHLNAVGRGDSHISVTGRINTHLADPAATGFDIRVVAVHLPLDDVFVAALRERHRPFFHSLFATSLFESFERSGLVGEAAQPADLEQRLLDIEKELERLTAAAPDRGNSAVFSRTKRERDRIVAQLERGPMRLGGNIHVDLRARRDVGHDEPTLLSGTVEPDAVGVMFDRFPYPFTVMGGMLEWSPDRITVATNDETEGLSVILPGGGRGIVTGSIDRPMIDGRRRTLPNLRFSLHNEPMNDVLAASIPLTAHDREHLPNADQWPGRALASPAQLIKSIALQGALAAEGTISTRAGQARAPLDEQESSAAEPADLHVTYHFDVYLENGSARPAAGLVDRVGAAGLFWPDGFTVNDVQGHLVVAEDRISLAGFHGWHDSGQVFATGMIDHASQPSTTALDVVLSDLDLHESMINIVPQENIDTVQQLWDRYQPRGRFTTELTYRETGGQRHPIEMVAVPAVCHISIDGEPVSFSAESGRLSVREGVVSFDDLQLDVRHGEEHHGSLRIAGSYGIADNGESLNPLHVDGAWTNAVVESPVIREVVRLVDEGRLRRWFESFAPTGRVNAVFAYESLRNDAERQYHLLVHPMEIAFLLNGTLIRATFDSESTVLLSPGVIELRNLAGQIERDAAFRLDGDVRLDEGEHAVAADLEVDFDGRVASDAVTPFLPRQVQTVLEQLSFDDGRATSVNRSRLKLRGMPRRGDTGQDDDEYDWDVSYGGRFNLHGASMQIGVPVTELDGTIDLYLRVTPDAPPHLMMSAAFDEMRVIDRLLTNVRADEIRLSRNGAAVIIPEIRGESYSGVVLANATIGVGQTVPESRYELKIELAGLALEELYADHASRVDDAETGGGARGRSVRGEVFGGVMLAGQHGRPNTRSGRGMLRAVGGDLENIPMLLQLMQVVQMTLPLRGELNQANAEFYIDGDRVVFERILFESTIGEQIAAFQLIGQGEMDLNTFEMRTQFRSRSGILLVRDVAGGLGDQLYLIEVTGTPAEPKARIVPFPLLLQPFSSRRPLSAAPPAGGQ